MNKKKLLVIPIFALVLVLSACTTPVEPENNNLDSDRFGYSNQIESNNQINQNNNSTNNSINIDNNNSISNKNMRTLNGHEDLAKEYSKAVINTSLGNITVELYGDESPVTVNNFLNLAKEGFYNSTRFHRVIKDFMIQGGDPNSKDKDSMTWGTGSPGYKFQDEFNSYKLVEGSLAMANSGPNTNGSQFFIVTAPETPWLDGMHTNFGKVVEGMDIVKEIEHTETGQRDIPVEPIFVNSIKLVK